MIYYFDVDNTLCVTEGTDYKNSKPILENIKKVNELYNRGETIIIWTGRGSVSGIDWRDFTVQQLKSWGLKYNKLLMGKPKFDYFVDDKARSAKEFFE